MFKVLEWHFQWKSISFDRFKAKADEIKIKCLSKISIEK